MKFPENELEPESILPAQVRDRVLTGARMHPEKRLQLAVLADAFRTFRKLAGKQRRRARRLFAEVDEWFASDAANGPFAFATICDSLGLDVDYMRRGLRQWRPLPAKGLGLPARAEILPRLGRVA